MEPKYTHRFPPCPIYDVETIEGWLEDLARHGIVLSGGGSFCGFVEFEKTEPKIVRYRLQPLQKVGPLKELDVDPQLAELAEALGWKLRCELGEYAVFAAEDPEAPEMDTDPQVHAMSVARLLRKSRRSLAGSVVLLFLLVGLVLWMGPVRVCLQNEIRYLAAIPLVFLVAFWQDIRQLRWLRAALQKLTMGMTLERNGAWRASCWRHCAGAVCSVLVLLLFYANLFWKPSLNWEMRPSELELPFASMEDLADGTFQPGNITQRNDHVALGFSLLTGRQIRLRQSGQVVQNGTETLSGALDVEYYELRTPWLARELFRELRQKAERTSADGASDTPELPTQQEYFYLNEYHFPTLLLLEGNKVAVIELLQYTQDTANTVPVEQWAMEAARKLVS